MCTGTRYSIFGMLMDQHSTLGTRHSALDIVRAYLELARPANVVTAWADILAGAAIAGLVAELPHGDLSTLSAAGFLWRSALHLGLLLLATTGLYAGGVVMNDVFDAEIDAAERPERAIPSGRASRTGAVIFGVFLLLVGVGAAFGVNQTGGWIALAVGLLAVTYDRFGKHHALLGPVNMGLCRAGNLMLGVSIVPAVLPMMWPLGFIPLIYIGAITAVSRGEVHGGSKKTGSLAVGLVLSILIALTALFAVTSDGLLPAIGFVLLFAWLVLPSFLKAARIPEPTNIRRAVRAGVMGLIPLNAAIAAGFAGWPAGIIVLLLLPVSIGLARLFAVT